MKKTITTFLWIIIIHISVSAQPTTFKRYENYILEPNSKTFVPEDCGEQVNTINVLSDKIIFNDNTYIIERVDKNKYTDDSTGITLDIIYYKCKTKRNEIFFFIVTFQGNKIITFSLAKYTDFISEFKMKKFTNS